MINITKSVEALIVKSLSMLIGKFTLQNSLIRKFYVLLDNLKQMERN